VMIVQKMHALGYRKIITTPHIMAGGYNNSPETILPGLEILKHAVDRSGTDILLEAAAEYYLDGNFEKLIESEYLLTFGDKHVLFELSYMYKPSGLENTVFQLNAAGYKPILAHPERYPYLFDKDLKSFRKIKESGVYFQLNLFSLVGVYGAGSQDIGRKLIDAEMIDFVGTDIHNQHQMQYLDVLLKSSYVKKLLDSELILNKTLIN
jgi:protein-tyrosine phosphatase